MLDREQRTQATAEPNLRDYTALLWRRKWWAIVPFVVALVGGVLGTMLVTPVYRAETMLSVNATVMRPQDVDPFSGLFLSREAVPTFVQLVKTPGVIDEARASLGLDKTGQGLGKVSSSQIGQTEFFVVSVEDRDPVLAYNAANALAKALQSQSEVDWQRRAATAEAVLRFQVDQLSQKIEATRRALAAAPTQQDSPRLSLELAQYERQYSDGLGTLQEYSMAMFRVTEVLTVRTPAVLPARPIRPQPLVYILTSLIVAVVFGMGLVFLVEHLDTKVKSPEEVTRLLGLPVIGALPVMAEPKASTGILDPIAVGSDPALEPYHLLRTNLGIAWNSAPSKYILVTSALEGEGKTTVLSNLGIALAMTGKRIVLVDADLRRPQLHRQFGLARSTGLADLLGEGNHDPSSYLRKTGLDSLQVLSAGLSEAQASPALLLGSDRMRQVLRDVGEGNDIVMVDTPPVLYSSDALALMEMMDQIILVIWSGMLRKETVEQIREVLSRAKAKKIEVVLNRVKRETDAYAYYYYQHYYGKYARQDRPLKPGG